MTQATEQPLFTSAHAALTYAFNFAANDYSRPLMYRMTKDDRPIGKGLTGVDGAAQAGFIRAEVCACGRLHEAVITACIAPRMLPCACGRACCKGEETNFEWLQAIHYIADHLKLRDGPLNGATLKTCTGKNGVTCYQGSDYVARVLYPRDPKLSLDAIAKRYGCSQRTVSTHFAAVKEAIKGHPKRKDAPAMRGLEDDAFDRIEERLRNTGMIGIEEAA